MASNKNQHFVPRCYLKPFTVNGENTAINLYNIDRNRFIGGAPVKNQCSGDYFYGQDAKLEAAIQSVESAYGSVLREVLKPGCTLSQDNCDVLKIFWMLQNLRTEAASRRSVEISDETLDVLGHIDSTFSLKIKEAVQIAMHAFAESMWVVDDLKVCLIKNNSDVPFITSDDPAILANRWYIDSKKTQGMSFGMRDAGALLLLPLSPEIYCICYDSDIYSISTKKSWLSTRLRSDVEALNELQVLNCRANLFVRDKDFAQGVHDFALKFQERRPKARHQINYAVFDGVENGPHKRYRVVEKSEFNAHQDGVIHFQTLHPRPSSWPSFLLRKHKGVAYYNDTGVGYVRTAHVEEEGVQPFRSVRAYE